MARLELDPELGEEYGPAGIETDSQKFLWALTAKQKENEETGYCYGSEEDMVYTIHARIEETNLDPNRIEILKRTGGAAEVEVYALTQLSDDTLIGRAVRADNTNLHEFKADLNGSLEATFTYQP